ncbi:MAG: hypothetical protein PF636_08215 [Actinomycetota bacterium]|nr:hypothetical protein [Actinomycetota bacterium]
MGTVKDTTGAAVKARPTRESMHRFLSLGLTFSGGNAMRGVAGSRIALIGAVSIGVVALLSALLSQAQGITADPSRLALYSWMNAAASGDIETADSLAPMVASDPNVAWLLP